MKKLFLFATLIIVLWSCWLPKDYYIIGIIDGDTVEVSHGLDIFRVRLIGIDAPEYNQPYGSAATKYLTRQILHKKVKLNTFGRDRYKRTLAVIYLNGKDINLNMIKYGMAEVYRGPSVYLKSEYIKAERKAMAAGRGIWSQKHYVSPRKFRHAKENL